MSHSHHHHCRVLFIGTLIQHHVISSQLHVMYVKHNPPPYGTKWTCYKTRFTAHFWCITSDWIGVYLPFGASNSHNPSDWWWSLFIEINILCNRWNAGHVDHGFPKLGLEPTCFTHFSVLLLKHTHQPRKGLIIRSLDALGEGKTLKCTSQGAAECVYFWRYGLDIQ